MVFGIGSTDVKNPMEIKIRVSNELSIEMGVEMIQMSFHFPSTRKCGMVCG